MLVRKVLLHKIGKFKKFVKSYRVICLLEYINKILKKNYKRVIKNLREKIAAIF